MENNCMVCGNPCKEIECFGNIKEMGVSFCDTHAEYCENCEVIKCKMIKNKDS